MLYKEIITKHEATIEYPEWIEVWAVVELSHWDMKALYDLIWKSKPKYSINLCLFDRLGDTLKKSNL